MWRIARVVLSPGIAASGTISAYITLNILIGDTSSTMVRRDNLVAVVRTAAFLTFSYSVFYMATHVTTPPVAQKLPYGKLKYLTFWDLVRLEF